MYNVKIYTDGSCSGNPGPMGVGIVIIDVDTGVKKEFSKAIGHGTNNIAELSAAIIGLSLLRCPRETNVELYTDSALVIGFCGDWKPKKNTELVSELRRLFQECNNFKAIKVKGHSDDIMNNRADELARAAI